MLCACAYIMCLCMHTHVCAFMSMDVRLCPSACVSAYLCLCVHSCACLCIAYMSVHVYLGVYISVFTYVHLKETLEM